MYNSCKEKLCAFGFDVNNKVIFFDLWSFSSVIISLLALIGWYLNIEVFYSLDLSSHVTTISTGILILSLSILSNLRDRLIFSIFSISIFLLCLYSNINYFFFEKISYIGNGIFSNHASPHISFLTIFLVGCCIGIRFKMKLLLELCLVVSSMALFIVFVGFIYDVALLYALDNKISLSYNSWLAFLFLIISIFSKSKGVSPNIDLLLFSKGYQGRITKKFLIFSIIYPVILAIFVSAGRRFGIYEVSYSPPLYITFTSLGFAYISLVLGRNQETLVLKESELRVKAENLKLSQLYQKELKLLNHRIIEAQENERKNLSRDLHDQLGQNLMVISMGINSIEMFNENKKNDAIISNTKVLVKETIEYIRMTSKKLRPSILDDLGLIEAIKWQMEEIKKFSSVDYVYIGPSSIKNLDEKTALMFYRVVQESITNVEKYSKAQNCNIQVTLNEQELSLIIEDDGIGFDFENISTENSFGLLGMKERAELIDAEIVIESEKNNGVTIKISVDVEERVEASYV